MNFKHPLILASSSPRRQFLMREAGFQFNVASPDIDESFPDTMAVEDIPQYLAKKKARVFETRISGEVVVTSDTVVILDKEVMNKPRDRDDAIDMLTRLSARTHLVITAVCIMSQNKMDCFDDRTLVTFRKLIANEIKYYIDTFRPYDKAGAYGAQECLPAGFNPCSPEEINFLQQIGKQDLVERSAGSVAAGSGNAIIEKIDGSYFTVMGLPLHLVFNRLNSF